MKLVDVSVKRPVGVIMFIITVLVLGAVSLKNLSVDLYPKIDVPVAVITTSYAGASPQEIEELISKPIEDSVGSLQGIKNVQSVSSPGASLVVLEFNWGRNIDESLNDIRESISRVSGMLPDGAGTPSVLRIDPQQIPVMWISLSGDSPENLQDKFKNQLEPYFERIDGVASVSVQGGKTREIQVELNQARLKSYGITANQVVQALSSENISASAGNLTKGAKDLQIRIDGEYNSVAEISDTLITSPNGAHVKLSDVASVKDTFKEMTTLSEVNGKPALVLSAIKESDGNTVKVADGIYKAIDKMQADLKDDGIKLSVIFDTSTFIRQSISSVVSNMIMGAILSALILLLFLRSIRSTFIVGVSIPIAIISTFILMYFTGETLNVLSMGGLALGIGMMVDSSIVILENIYRLRSQGMPIMEAAKKGASELGPAVIASTLTSAVVFVPIVFVKGLAAELFRPLALTVTFSLLASLIAAITIVPMMSSRLLANVNFAESAKKEVKPRKWRVKLNQFVAKLIEKYKALLIWALHHRKTVLAGTAALVIGSFGLIPFIGASFIPESDQGQISIKMTADSGVKLEETSKMIEQANKRINKYKDAIDINYVMIGGSTTGFGASPSNQAEYIVKLVDKKERDITTNELVQKLEQDFKDIPGAEFTITAQDPGMGGSTSPIQVQISGPDLDVLEDLAQQVAWIIEDVKGTFNVKSSVSEGRPEIQVHVNRELAAQYGISYQQILNQVKLGFNGQVATHFRENGSEYDVSVVLPEDQRHSIRDLENSKIRTASGLEIPLSSVAELKQVQGPTEINRDNQQRQVNVTSDIRDRDLGSINKEINEKLDQLRLPDDYTISSGGQTEEMMDAFGQLAIAFGLSIFLVYFVMAVQFDSFKYPFIIMFSLPTTAVGVLVGLFITGNPISIPAFIGIIMLGGIVVNNGILLVEYINIQRAKGMELFDAILDSGLTRMRPIFMTTLTTVLGMVPLALGIGEGTESQTPMAVAIIFGLLFSTVFTLVLVPVIYTTIDGSHRNRRKGRFLRFFRFNRQKKNNEDVTF